MKERLNALKVALDNEVREREFYELNAKRTTNPIGKAMFEQIAADELEHYQRLRQLHDKWAKDEKWPETVPLTVGNSVVGGMLKDLLQKTKEGPTADADDLQAIRTAIDFEEKGAVYYAMLRDNITDPKEKAFFALMANIEHEHYVSLKETEEYFIDPVSWFRRTERSGLDGG